MRYFLLPLLAASALASQTPDSLFRARRFDEARSAHQALLAKDKNDANATYWMGRIAEAQDRHDDAIDWFEKALKLDDTKAPYHFWLGSAIGGKIDSVSKLRQPFLAKRLKKEFERAVELDPKMVEPHLGLVDYYSQAPGFMGGSMEKAREQVAEVTKLNPYRGHLAAANLAAQAKDAAAEEREYRAGIAAAPDSLQSYWNLAALYRRHTNWDEAFGVYEQIMKIAPDQRVAHLGWGAVSALSGKSLERGERELKLFLQTATVEQQGNQNIGGAHFRLGQIYEKTARKDLAKAEYGEALKANPKHPEAKKALDALK